MSKGLNTVMLIGNLGADPDMKYIHSGTAIANFNLATAESKKDKDGNWEDYTEWHRVVAFGKNAEVAKDYLKKGSKCYIEGRLQTRSWEDKDGVKKYTTEIIANVLIMLDGKPTGCGDRQHAPKPQAGPSQDDSLPF